MLEMIRVRGVLEDTKEEEGKGKKGEMKRGGGQNHRLRQRKEWTIINQEKSGLS